MKRSEMNNKYTKFLVIGLVLVLSLAWCTGCGTKSSDTQEKDKTVAAQEISGSKTDSATDSTGQQGDKGTTDKTTTDGTNAGSNNTTGKTGDGTSSGSNTNTGGSTTGNGSTTSGGDTTTPTTPAKTCTIQINCSLLVGQDLSSNGLATLVPSNGVILGTTKVTILPGDTVYDVTLRVVKSKKIQMESQGTAAVQNLYIASINNIYEKAYNSKSGWVYLINGKKPGIGCSVQTLKAGDALVWAYSLNYGNDL
jgi:hypothetical protein